MSKSKSSPELSLPNLAKIPEQRHVIYPLICPEHNCPTAEVLSAKDQIIIHVCFGKHPPKNLDDLSQLHPDDPQKAHFFMVEEILEIPRYSLIAQRLIQDGIEQNYSPASILESDFHPDDWRVVYTAMKDHFQDLAQNSQNR